jgi:TonB family protein
MLRRNRAVAFLFSVCLLVGLVPFAIPQQDANGGHRKMSSKVVPVYPALAHNMNISGTVRVEAVVAPNGTVKSASVLGGHPVLAESALDAVRKSKWESAPHETKELVILNFHPE